ncbi:DUF6776 family protein [Luteimonas sp. FCS-9]|uniref:DUF6776 family protein n=1 Tax=Luteimonas sp. FCS-9 TaxID=1547516 RepID=UPI00063E7F32|nr:DUF6776 family protein [Luteimonas sp. FCS-9]KLI99420.1 hypothetical protein WQ56_12260 [Luteimonas sp. FCS-9]
MTRPAPSGQSPSPSPPGTPVRSAQGLRWTLALLVLVALSLLFGSWGAWQLFAPGAANPQRQLAAQAAQIEDLQQQVATLTRSDQISRDANRELQGTLAERDEEIAALRADVAFYERFVGSTTQGRGLTVHELRMQPRTDQGWHYTATLTQSLARDAASAGEMRLAIEGTRDGRLETLAWSDLRQRADAAGVPYSFKYFQQVEGDVVLPPGFQPLRVTVRLAPAGRGAAVERAFSWADVTPRSVPDA